MLGRTITLDGGGYTIVGVIPADFDLSVRSFRHSEIYVPIGQWNNNFLLQSRSRARNPWNRPAQARSLHRTGSRGHGRSDAQSFAAYPDSDKGIGAAVLPLKQDMLGDVRPLFILLLGAVCFVLLIACVNVANLLLARSTRAGASLRYAQRWARTKAA